MKRVLFLTGTRADFGKIKELVLRLQDDKDFDVTVFVTGMHMNRRYGLTINEVHKAGINNVFPYYNSSSETSMDLMLSRTIEGLSHYIRENQIDAIIVHGDRVEALAGAITGALNNVHVIHIEGGELSGTIDDLIRHSVSKLAHSHFVANENAKRRLVQLGEAPETIYVIGSPDVDVLLSKSLPNLEETKNRYSIPFDEFAIAAFHPVTTEVDHISEYVESFVEAMLGSGLNYVVIQPNNDLGSNFISDCYSKRISSNPKFRIFPSIRFEYYLTLLKNCKFIIGNSSAGIRESPYYGVRAVNIGTRQNRRSNLTEIVNTDYTKASISKGIQSALTLGNYAPIHLYGAGDSSTRFISVLKDAGFWDRVLQKQFYDLT